MKSTDTEKACYENLEDALYYRVYHSDNDSFESYMSSLAERIFSPSAYRADKEAAFAAINQVLTDKGHQKLIKYTVYTEDYTPEDVSRWLNHALRIVYPNDCERLETFLGDICALEKGKGALEDGHPLRIYQHPTKIISSFENMKLYYDVAARVEALVAERQEKTPILLLEASRLKDSTAPIDPEIFKKQYPTIAALEQEAILAERIYSRVYKRNTKSDKGISYNQLSQRLAQQLMGEIQTLEAEEKEQTRKAFVLPESVKLKNEVEYFIGEATVIDKEQFSKEFPMISAFERSVREKAIEEERVKNATLKGTIGHGKNKDCVIC